MRGEMTKHGQFAIIPARALDDVRLDGKDKHLRALLVLGTYADKNGRCFPSLSTIGKQIGAARSTASGIVHDLESWGYVSITEQTKEDSGQTSNMYRIIHDAELPVQFDRTTAAPPVQNSRMNSDTPLQTTSVVSDTPLQNSRMNSDTNVPIERPNLTLSPCGENELPEKKRARAKELKDPLEYAAQWQAQAEQRVNGAAIANPREARKKYAVAAANEFAAVLQHDRPTSTDTAAAKRAFDLHIPLADLTAYCARARNGDGKKYRDKPDATAFWIVNELENRRARGNAPAVNDHTLDFIREAMQR